LRRMQLLRRNREAATIDDSHKGPHQIEIEDSIHKSTGYQFNI